MGIPHTPILSKKDEGSMDLLFLQFQQSRDDKIREELILHHMNLVRQLARRFARRGKAVDVLVSVGSIALIKAIDRYDPNRGVQFVTYATHVISGEIKRYFRDKGWTLKVPRRLKELNAAIHVVSEKLTHEHSRSPTIEEIATALNISNEEVLESLEARHAHEPYYLDSHVDYCDARGAPFINFIAKEDRNLKQFFDRFDLEETLQMLPNREQMIIQFFYYEDFSQAKIAKRLGISQMHVSRLLSQAIKNLRKFMKETPKKQPSESKNFEELPIPETQNI